MKNTPKHFLFIIFFGLSFLYQGTAKGQAPVFSMSASQSIVQEGERFGITLRLESNKSVRGHNLSVGRVSSLQLVVGPSLSQQSSISIVNGKQVASYITDYTFIYQATKTGTFTVPSASIEVDGKKLVTNSIQIQVAKASSGGGNASSSSKSTSSSSQGNLDELYIQVIPTRRTVYLGEPIRVEFKLFSKVSLQSVSHYKNPSYSGFWSHVLQAPKQFNPKREIINNQRYTTVLLREELLYPQQTGKLTIQPGELTVSVPVQSSQRRRSIFDDFFSNVEVKIRQLRSKPVTINVKELPPAPPDFQGAVGQFTLSSHVDKKVLKANQALTFKLTIKGTGGFKLIQPPKLDFPSDFESYEPKITENSKALKTGIVGSKVFEWLLIPRNGGDFTIPSASLSYFDPKTKSYKRLTTPEYAISVAKGDKEQTTTVVSSPTARDVQFIGQDIQYIKEQLPSLSPIGKFFFGSWLFWVLWWAPALFLAILWLLNRRRIHRNMDIARTRNRKAVQIASKRLKEARRAMHNNDKKLFYEALLNGMWGFLSDKMALPLADLSKKRVEEELKSRAVEPAQVQELIAFIDKCEFARFAPAAAHSELSEEYQTAAGLVNKINRVLS